MAVAGSRLSSSASSGCCTRLLCRIFALGWCEGTLALCLAQWRQCESQSASSDAKRVDNNERPTVSRHPRFSLILHSHAFSFVLCNVPPLCLFSSPHTQWDFQTPGLHRRGARRNHVGLKRIKRASTLTETAESATLTVTIIHAWSSMVVDVPGQYRRKMCCILVSTPVAPGISLILPPTYPVFLRKAWHLTRPRSERSLLALRSFHVGAVASPITCRSSSAVHKHTNHLSPSFSLCGAISFCRASSCYRTKSQRHAGRCHSHVIDTALAFRGRAWLVPQ